MLLKVNVKSFENYYKNIKRRVLQIHFGINFAKAYIYIRNIQIFFNNFFFSKKKKDERNLMSIFFINENDNSSLLEDAKAKRDATQYSN